MGLLAFKPKLRKAVVAGIRIDIAINEVDGVSLEPRDLLAQLRMNSSPMLDEMFFRHVFALCEKTYTFRVLRLHVVNLPMLIFAPTIGALSEAGTVVGN